MHYSAVLFDMDGTLTDSFEGITRSIQAALAAFGIREPDLNALKKFIGPPAASAFRDYYGFDEETSRRAVEKYRQRFSTVGIYENTLYDGIVPMLAALKERGIPLAVASSKPEVFVRRILEHFSLDGYFAVAVGSELDGARSDKAQVLAYAMTLLGNPSRPVMVGDRFHDGEGAKKCGVDFVGALYGYGSQEELEPYRPVFLAQTVVDLHRFLLRATLQRPNRI